MRTSVLGRWLAGSAAVVLAATACAADDTTDDDETGDIGLTDDEDDVDEADDADEAAAGAPGLAGCAEDPAHCNSGERADGGSITWLVDQTPDAWFSISSAGGSVYSLQMHQGIMPHTGQWLPDTTYEYNFDLLAAEPELVSEAPLVAEFRIREEAVWHDGTPITADDFRLLWWMSTAEGEGHCVGCDSRASDGFDIIESIEGSDDGRTVTITYKEGQGTHEWYSYANAHSITGGLVPYHVGVQEGFDLDTPEGVGEYFEHLHTTMPTWSGGPYMLVEGDLENQVIKEPNPAWYGEVQPTLDTVVIRFLDDAGSWVPSISNREVHGGSPAAFEEDVVAQLEQLPGVDVAIASGPSWSHLDVNTDHPQLADVELRRAIFVAIDADDMAERVWGSAFPDYRVRKNHIFPEDSPYFVDHLTETGQGSGDIDLALEILDDAGYEFDGELLTLDGEQVGPFRLRSGATTVLDTTTALIQSYLARIGIEVTLETTDELAAMLAAQDYDLAQFGWSSSPAFANAAAQFWSSESGSNFGRYENSEVDEVAAAALNAPTIDESAEYANEAYRLVVQDAYVLPLYDAPVFITVTDEYVNVRDNVNSSLRGQYEPHHWGLVATE
jgi:peptide/nickel transport system substrate-binding protein